MREHCKISLQNENIAMRRRVPSFHGAPSSIRNSGEAGQPHAHTWRCARRASAARSLARPPSRPLARTINPDPAERTGRARERSRWSAPGMGGMICAWWWWNRSDPSLIRSFVRSFVRSPRLVFQRGERSVQKAIDDSLVVAAADGLR